MCNESIQYNKWVSLSETSDKNIDLFYDIQFILDVPVIKRVTLH